MAKLNCSSCNSSISSTDKFCPDCGTAVQAEVVNEKKCSKCGAAIPVDAVFCESCGTKLQTSDGQQTPNPEPKRIVAQGNYSGKLSTGHSKLLTRLVIAGVSILVIAAIALIIWFQVDDNAGEKLKKAIELPLTVIIVLFALYTFIFGKSKKRKRRRGGGGYSDVADDNDDDYDDDGDWGDDGGGDDD